MPVGTKFDPNLKCLLAVSTGGWSSWESPRQLPPHSDDCLQSNLWQADATSGTPEHSERSDIADGGILGYTGRGMREGIGTAM